jgi:hypothetical protein
LGYDTCGREDISPISGFPCTKQTLAFAVTFTVTVDTALGLPLGIIQITGESRRTRGSPRTNIWYSVCPFWTPYSGLTCGAIESGDPIVPLDPLGAPLGPRGSLLAFITWNADATFWTLGS